MVFAFKFITGTDTRGGVGFILAFVCERDCEIEALIGLLYLRFNYRYATDDRAGPRSGAGP